MSTATQRMPAHAVSTCLPIDQKLVEHSSANQLHAMCQQTHPSREDTVLMFMASQRTAQRLLAPKGLNVVIIQAFQGGLSLCDHLLPKACMLSSLCLLPDLQIPSADHEFAARRTTSQRTMRTGPGTCQATIPRPLCRHPCRKLPMSRCVGAFSQHSVKKSLDG